MAKQPPIKGPALDVGLGPNQVVQRDSSGNIDADTLEGASIGTNGGDIVQLTGSPAALPAADGSNLTNVIITPPTVTDHTAPGLISLLNSLSLASYPLLSISGAGNADTIGPSGAGNGGNPGGATFSWTAMDQIPNNATGIIFHLALDFDVTSDQNLVRFGFSPVGAGWSGQLTYEYRNEGVSSGQIIRRTNNIVVPLDSDLFFEIDIISVQNATLNTADLIYTGYIT